MMQLSAFAIAAGQKLPEGFDPQTGKVLALTGICMQQDGTNNADVPAIIIQCVDVQGVTWLMGTTYTLFMDVIDHLKKAKEAWDRGEAPPIPGSQVGKNPANPGLN